MDTEPSMDVRIAILEKEVSTLRSTQEAQGNCQKELRNTIEGEGKEEGMKTVLARTDERLGNLCDQVSTITRIGLWIIALMATGVLSFVWEMTKKGAGHG